MATRTAPTVNGTPPVVYTTLHLIDASGDVSSVAIKSNAVPSDIDIEAWASTYQAITQASLYKVTVSLAYEGDADPQNADVGQRNSVADGINMLYRDITALASTTPRLVAPVDGTLQGNQDIPLISFGPFVAMLTAQGALLPTFQLVSTQFTERRERRNNPRVKI